MKYIDNISIRGVLIKSHLNLKMATKETFHIHELYLEKNLDKIL